jgi:hypothetical protein
MQDEDGTNGMRSKCGCVPKNPGKLVKYDDTLQEKDGSL